MGSSIAKDVPPYMMVSGAPAHPHGLNSEGLKRRGFSSETLATLKKAYKLLYRSGLPFDEALAAIRGLEADCAEVTPLREFLEHLTRGIIR
jgi:UDP-N-acetylglucosamine acyltransferase